MNAFVMILKYRIIGNYFGEDDRNSRDDSETVYVANVLMKEYWTQKKQNRKGDDIKIVLLSVDGLLSAEIRDLGGVNRFAPVVSNIARIEKSTNLKFLFGRRKAEINGVDFSSARFKMLVDLLIDRFM